MSMLYSFRSSWQAIYGSDRKSCAIWSRPWQKDRSIPFGLFSRLKMTRFTATDKSPTSSPPSLPSPAPVDHQGGRRDADLGILKTNGLQVSHFL